MCVCVHVYTQSCFFSSDTQNFEEEHLPVFLPLWEKPISIVVLKGLQKNGHTYLFYGDKTFLVSQSKMLLIKTNLKPNKIQKANK